MCVQAMMTLCLICSVLGFGQVTAPDEVREQIARLERQLQERREFSFGLHNKLRHLYSNIDTKKSLAHCNAIFRHDPTNEYTLDCIGARNADHAKAIMALLNVAAKHADLVALASSCQLKAAALSDDPAQRRALLRQVAVAKGRGLERHRALASARLAAMDRPKTDAPWTMPVLVINYFPLTKDKTRIDQTVTSNVSTPVAEIEAKCKQQTLEVIEALEQGSRFRPYRNPQAKPSLKYTVVDTITYYEAVPQHPKKRNYADYQQIMARVRIRDWVETKGIREVWIWGYHSKEIAPVESNMASIHGNVSNSQRDASDLPVLGHTYTVYHYNYGRGTDMAVHNHLHQIEAVMRHHGGELWKTFEGRPDAWRCGNCHFPVNAEKDYDYENKRYVDTDIEDWKPEGFGRKQRINCDRWSGDDMKWYVYWMQAIPGRHNQLTYQDARLSNWWEFIGDYDQAVMRMHKLTE